MAQSWKEIVVDYIRAKLATGKVMFGTKARYEQSYSLIDFTDDDLINKRALSGAVPAVPPAPTTITAGVTATPLTVAYSGTDSTGYVLKNLTGSPAGLIDNNTNVTYDGANFVIYGADDGTGKFADSFIFGIKP